MKQPIPGKRRRQARNRQAWRTLLETPRFEIIPLPGIADRLTTLPAGAKITVTASPRHGVEATVGLTESLARRGFAAVPHLAARQFADEDQLTDALRRLHEAGVRDLFVVGGDDPGSTRRAEPLHGGAGIGERGASESAGRGETPYSGTTKAGVFPDGLSLLKAIDAATYRFDEIGVPSYPEGHPNIDDDVLWSALLAKQYYATYTVTQMCFDADAIRRFATDARAHGITLPIIAGVPGAVAAAKLLRVSFRIGVGDSVRFVRKHRAAARRLLRPHGYRPDGLLRALASAPPLVEGLHIYTFNEIAPTVRWLDQRRRSLHSGEEVAADDHAV